MRRATHRRTWISVAAAVLAALVTSLLVLAVAQHDPVAHAQGQEDHGCAVSVFTNAQDAGAPVVDVPDASVDRIDVPEAVHAPVLVSVSVEHPARGPPSTRV